VTKYCRQGTLKKLTHENMANGEWLKESELKHIGESLARAVDFLHHGPDSSPREWDPVTHRDIILGNLFLEFTTDPLDLVPWKVLLADFGCATSRSEFLASRRRCTLMNLPLRIHGTSLLRPSAW
jgi:serine/threonine protein kinase